MGNVANKREPVLSLLAIGDKVICSLEHYRNNADREKIEAESNFSGGTAESIGSVDLSPPSLLVERCVLALYERLITQLEGKSAHSFGLRLKKTHSALLVIYIEQLNCILRFLNEIVSAVTVAVLKG